MADFVGKRPVNPQLGYTFASLTMLVSGVAIYVNSIGVKMFPDSTLYTLLKNALVGTVLLGAFVVSSDARAELCKVSRREISLLLVVALLGGSIAYALDFRGLQIATPVTASLIDHTLFVFVALLAALLLRERVGGAVWAAMGVLLVGLTIGVKFDAVRWDAGVPYLLAATALFAVDFILVKYLLRTVSALTVMTFKMSVGAAFLLAFVAATGHLGLITRLRAIQWEFIAVTGVILLAFTVTSILGLRHASATTVTAIPASAPIVTTVLVALSREAAIAPVKWLGLALILAALLAIVVFGFRRELRLARPGQFKVM